MLGKGIQGLALMAVGAVFLSFGLFPQISPLATVIIDTTPPYITSISPDGTQTSPGTVYPGGTISVTVKDDTSGLKAFYLNKVVDSQVTYLIREENLNGVKEKTFTWTVSESVGTILKLAIGVEDMAGNQLQPVRFFWVKVTEKPKYTLTVNISGQGTVSVSGYGVYSQPMTFDEGTQVTLTATPSNGWEFTGWTGAVTSSNTSITFTIKSNTTVTANFKEIPKEFYVTVRCEPSNGGYVTPSSGYYPNGQSVSFQATAAKGYKFSYWKVDSTTLTTNPVSITVNSAKTLTAVFEQLQAPEGELFVNNQKVTGSIILNTRELTFTFVPSKSAELIKRVYLEISSQGTLELVKQPDGKYVKIWTAPSDGTYTITSKLDWEVGTVTIASISVSLTTGQLPRENYPPPPPDTFNLYFSCDPPDGGSISGIVPSAKKGERVSLEAIPNKGYVFKCWEGDIYSTNPTLSFTVERDMTIRAVFEKEEKPVSPRSIFLAVGTLLIILGALRLFL